MRQTKQYSASTKAANDAKALADCRAYIGVSFNKACGALAMQIRRSRSLAQAYRDVRNLCGKFLGIYGYYPVRAMFREALRHLG